MHAIMPVLTNGGTYITVKAHDVLVMAHAAIADIDNRRPGFEHRSRVGTRFLRIVEELAAIGKAVGRDVENAHDLRLVEPDRPRPALEGRMHRTQPGPLRQAFLGQRGGQAGQRRLHFRHGNPFAHDDLAAVPHDQREAMGIDHASAEPDRVPLLGLRAGGEADGANVEVLGHRNCNLTAVSARGNQSSTLNR